MKSKTLTDVLQQFNVYEFYLVGLKKNTNCIDKKNNLKEAENKSIKLRT